MFSVVRLAGRKKCNPGVIRSSLDGLINEVRDHNKRLDRIEKGMAAMGVDISWLKKSISRVERWQLAIIIGIITSILTAVLI